MKFKALAIDVDGVITKIHSAWRYVHECLNVQDKAKINAELYYSKKISYYKWAELDIKLWDKISYDELIKLFEKVEIRDYCKEFFDFLRNKKVKVIAISGGLTPLLETLAKKLYFDHYVANDLYFDNEGKLNGKFKINVTPTNKGKVLANILYKLGINNKECIGIGDSDFDIPMLKICGYKIAFNPKNETLIKIADEVIYSDTFYELYEKIRKILNY
jgi:phosphoserine phosphatase